MKIVFTGGGTAGHVTPNLALIESLSSDQSATTNPHRFIYVGSHQGIEKNLASGHVDKYYGISSGKLRRYKSWRNLLTPFQVLLGIIQAIGIAWREKPDVIFSKGGFVAFPMVIAGAITGVPVIVHESDLTPGLANRLSYPFAKIILVSFEQTKLPKKYRHKCQVTGAPIRKSLLVGSPHQGRKLCGFKKSLPCLLCMGGSTGSQKINQLIREALPQLTHQFQIIHLCGAGNLDPSLKTQMNYRQFEYANEELADLLACADAVISRAGANSIAEWLALRKPHLLIPLSNKVSRGDQIANAKHFEQCGTALVCPEDEVDTKQLLSNIDELMAQSNKFIDRMNQLTNTNGIDTITLLILNRAEMITKNDR